MLNTIIFGTYTVKDLLPYAIGLAVILIIWKIVKALFMTEEMSEHAQIVKCQSCGWQGQVSRYAGKCPKCSEPLGDRKAKPNSAKGDK